MTEYSKRIFSDPKALRQKLEIYLQTPEKVEIYAQAAEKSLASTGGNSLGFVATWSWWGFFMTWCFFLYRKCYISTVVALVLGAISGGTLGGVVMIASGVAGKWVVLKRFEKYLDLQSDELLAINGGFHKWVVWVGVAFLAFIVVLFALYGLGAAAVSTM